MYFVIRVDWSLVQKLLRNKSRLVSGSKELMSLSGDSLIFWYLSSTLWFSGHRGRCEIIYHKKISRNRFILSRTCCCNIIEIKLSDILLFQSYENNFWNNQIRWRDTIPKCTCGKFNPNSVIHTTMIRWNPNYFKDKIFYIKKLKSNNIFLKYFHLATIFVSLWNCLSINDQVKMYLLDYKLICKLNLVVFEI